jgi:hypothetical protein
MGPSVLVVILLGAAGLALFQRKSSADSSPALPANALDDAAMPIAAAGEPPLPPNHPPLAARGTGSSFAAEESPPALAWTAPSGWEVAPNRSLMRLATYRVPAAGGRAGASVELTVTRAGGSTADNLERWVGQFDGAGPDRRTERTVAGFRLSILEVAGTYEGGMTKTGSETAHPGWALLGAVVETDGPFYFFKMVGPVDAVRAARPAFDALMSSVRKPG